MASFRIKKQVAVLGCVMFFVVCMSLYLMLESSTAATSIRYMDMGENDLSSIESKIKQIEVDLQRNHLTINLIKKTVRELAEGNVTNWDALRKALEVQLDDVDKQAAAGKGPMLLNISTLQEVALPKDMCNFAERTPIKPDIQMIDVYEALPFDNPDGGAWKQGFPITYPPDSFSSLPLQVFVVPHSHNDPGWIKTFDKYFTDQTKNILNMMVEKLEQYPKMRFIYAEISFFQAWWNSIDEAKKNRVKKLLKEKRFELVTGGWVMTDEANAHYYAMLDQLVEGQQWMYNQLGEKVESGWAIDPFGATPTMAYLLKQLGLHNMLIQRVHYSIKKHLASTKGLEFMWRQNWDGKGTSDMFCHMMPFYSYDVPHTCGPDPKICCQFDFRRLPGGRVNCPWKIPPVPITDSNIQQKAEQLLDQYRKKAQLYRNNVVLIPLGDDFRYDKAFEWDKQYENYQKLFDYMNGRPDLHVQARFGTLTDYFNALYERGKVKPGERPEKYPVLSGDFFSYSDRDDHYWTGYFTSRPFYKKMDRQLEFHLRAAEILYSLAVATARQDKASTFSPDLLMGKLVQARRHLGLFQHHDAITGTAKDFVMLDYGNKLLQSMKQLKTVIASAADYLLHKDKSRFHYSEEPMFDMDEIRANQDSLPEKTVIQVSSVPKPVVFYNSLGHARTEVKRIYVSQPHVEVTDSQGQVVTTQVDPFWLNNEEFSSSVFKVNLLVAVPAFGLSRYQVRAVSPSENLKNFFSKITIHNGGSLGTKIKNGFDVMSKGTEEILIENNELQVRVNGATGMIQHMKMKVTGEGTDVKLQFLKYGTRGSKEKSGAYLFLPDGDAVPVDYKPPVTRVVQGPLVSEIHTFIPHVEHVIRLPSSPGVDSSSVEIMNIVDIRTESNKELAMRIETGVFNKDGLFYTDLNGYQIQRRKTYAKLPKQANFYPMPTMAYLEDEKWRFSVLTGQSLGVASLRQGWIEVIQDRRLNQDDNRGLGQGVLDNKRTPNTFRLLLEPRTAGYTPKPSHPTGYPSLLSHASSLHHIYPLYVLPPRDGAAAADLLPSFSPLSKDLPCELHFVTLRAMQGPEGNSIQQVPPREDSALILHRLGIDCGFPNRGLQCSTSDGKVSLKSLFNSITVDGLQSSSLSLLDNAQDIPVSQELQLQPMEIKAYKLKLH